MRGVSSTIFDTTVPALTLKVGDYAIHHGGLGITRTLGRIGVPVFGIHEDRFAPAGLSRYTTGRFVWRTGDQHRYEDQLLVGISEVADWIGTPAVLIPTDDHAAMFVADHAETLRRWFLFPPQSASLVRDLTDKAALNERCRVLGVPFPATTVVSRTDQLESFAAATSFPVVAKRAKPWLLPNGRRTGSTQVVRRRSELLQLDVSSPLLLQEHIADQHGEDWLFHAYCDATSECLVAFTGRKVRAFPPSAGETALGRSVNNPTLAREARSLLRNLGYSGVASLDYRLDKRDGTYKLLDFNPRVGAIFRLFQSESRVDVVRALHLDMTGRAVPAGRAVEGRVLAVEGHEIRSGWSGLRSGDLTVRGWLSSWRTVRETAWLARDDLLPALVALARVAGRALLPRGRRRWRCTPPRALRGRARRGGW
jgi:predicted ATP-grasp superfamily ATP-dependent carboligase